MARKNQTIITPQGTHTRNVSGVQRKPDGTLEGVATVNGRQVKVIHTGGGTWKKKGQ